MQNSSPLKVLEIGSYAAAYCGRLWARTGADVVQVKNKDLPPSWVSEEAMQMFCDGGKRRIRTSDSKEMAALAAKADVVICEAATADELLDLGFDDWATPIKVALTPFGLTGPKRNWRATPNVLLAMGGYTNVIGAPDREPLNLPGHYAEFQTGALGFAAAQAAQFAGQGDVIDIGMLEVIVSLHHYTTVRYHADGQIRERRGSDPWFVVPSDLFSCRDGWVYITVTPSFWEMFVLLLDRPELTLDDRFANNDARMENRDALREIIAGVFSDLTCEELEMKAEEYRVPLGIAQSPAEVLQDRHLDARSFWDSVEHPLQGVVNLPGIPWRGQHLSKPALAPLEMCDWSAIW